MRDCGQHGSTRRHFLFGAAASLASRGLLSAHPDAEVSTGLAARMVNKPSTCNNRSFLEGTLVGNKPSGHLLAKMLSDVAGCGVRMPPAAALSATELACVDEWAVQAIQKQTGASAP